ncbi:MAG: hypothetical protein SAJ37_21745, partial [Oscillatoria sp. PMC 1068.18]|nr:hypothetical protein [Oscillatoria sp. PMC 1076.18]MEC4991366.1 hypothetical protein [Oscillatoria sp. PMC 1068.18]
TANAESARKQTLSSHSLHQQTNPNLNLASSLRLSDYSKRERLTPKARGNKPYLPTAFIDKLIRFNC